MRRLACGLARPCASDERTTIPRGRFDADAASDYEVGQEGRAAVPSKLRGLSVLQHSNQDNPDHCKDKEHHGHTDLDMPEDGAQPKDREEDAD